MGIFVFQLGQFPDFLSVQAMQYYCRSHLKFFSSLIQHTIICARLPWWTKTTHKEDLVRLQRQHKQSQMVTNQSFFMGHPDSRQKLGRIVKKPLEVSMHELT